MGSYAPDSLYHVFGDVSWPAQVVHMCAAQMGAVSGLVATADGSVVSMHNQLEFVHA